MKFSDIVKISILYNKRRKKKMYFAVLLLCCIICLIITIFYNNIVNIINENLNQNAGFRTIMVSLATNDNNDIEKISKIENVLDVYNSENGEYNVTLSSIDEEEFDGNLTIKRSTLSTLPPISEQIEEITSEKSYLICPESFYPYSDVMKISKERIISGKDILGKKFNLTYYEYKYGDNNNLITNNTYSKEIEVLGLYDNSKTMDNNGTCYMNSEDLSDIVLASTKYLNASENYNDGNISITVTGGLNVVVDNINNVDKVVKKLKDMEYNVDGLVCSFDETFIEKSLIFVSVIAFISIFAITFITTLFAKKNLVVENENIMVAKAQGFSNKDVLLIYLTENFICNFNAYLIGSILVTIIYLILKNNNPYLLGIDMMIGGIHIGIIPFIITFNIVVIIPTIIIGFFLLKKLRCNLKLLIGNK